MDDGWRAGPGGQRGGASSTDPASGAAPATPGGTGTVNGLRTLLLTAAPPDETAAPEPEDVDRGDARARLVFRVGLVDETLADLGVTMLGLRLAAATVPAGVGVRVWVGPTTSSVSFVGPEDAVADALAATARRLADLEVDLLDAVRERVEAEERAGVLPRAQLSSAESAGFGARGSGVLAYRLLALSRLQIGELRAWANSHLVAENAVLFAEGLDRDRLDVQLPRGAWLPEPAPGRFGLPGGSRHAAGSETVLSFPAPRSWATHLATAVLGRRAGQRLDADAAAVQCAMTALTRSDVLISVHVVPLPEREQACADGVVEALLGLAVDLPVHGVIDAQRRAAAAGELPASEVAAEVTEELLLGGELGDAGSPQRALEVGIDDVRAVLTRGAALAVLVGPVAPTVSGWEHVPAPVPRIADGAVFVARAHGGVRALVGRDGVALDAVEDPGVGAAWDEVALVVAQHSGSLVQLFLGDGRELVLGRASWRGRRRDHDIVATVLERATGRTAVRTDPDRRSGVVDGRFPLDAQSRSQVRMWIYLAVSCGLIALALGVAALAGSRPGPGVAGALFASLTALAVRAARRRHRRGGPAPGQPNDRADVFVAADLAISGAGRTALLALTVALWTVPTVAVTALFLAEHAVVWPLFVLYSWAYRTTQEFRRRSRDPGENRAATRS